ncbi:MAG: hypothetical protein HND47_20230 [Chloroflexi bacterium]|nr:hypothetical protein [Chloroflexota bacterium]
MDQMPSNMPVMESKPGPAGWVQTWVTAITKPNEQTYIDLTEQPNANAKTAFLWVFIAGTISGIFQAILQAIYAALGITPQLPFPGMEQFNQFQPAGGGAGSIGVSLLTGLCLSPVGGLFAMLFFAILVAVVQWIAKLFGGVGTFEKLAYAFAAISFPFTLISSVLALFNAIPFVGICISVISFGLVIYALVLEIMAVKGVNRFGWGPAVGSVLIPVFVFFLVCVCVVVIGMMMLGPVIGEVFSGMQYAP